MAENSTSILDLLGQNMGLWSNRGPLYDIGRGARHPLQETRNFLSPALNPVQKYVGDPSANVLRNVAGGVASGFVGAPAESPQTAQPNNLQQLLQDVPGEMNLAQPNSCLLYTSDAADE